MEALELLKHSGKSASQLERELGVTKGLLLKWRDRYQIRREQGEVSLAPTDLAAAQREVRRLQCELAIAEQERDILKKSSEHLQSPRALKYAFIAAHTGEYPVRRMCKVLGVSPSGHYDWLSPQASGHTLFGARFVNQHLLSRPLTQQRAHSQGYSRLQALLHRELGRRLLLNKVGS